MKAAAPKKSLFSRVMALPSFKQARAKKPFVPTAKGKAKAKKLAASKKIPGLDVFDVMLESDAGSDSQKRRAQWFDKHLADLSEAQLCQMKRKVNTVCRRVLRFAPDAQDIAQATENLNKAIEDRLSQSRCHLVRLRAAVVETLESIPVDQVEVNERNEAVALWVNGERYSMQRLVKHFFWDFVHEYQRLVYEKKIIPHHSNTGGCGFVLRQLQRCNLCGW